MAKGLGTLTVWLNTDTSKFSSGLSKAAKTLSSWKTSVSIGAAAVGASMAALGVSSVRAFMTQEDAVNSLSAALQSAGDSVSDYLPSLEKVSSEIQKQTKYGDEAVISAMAYGKNLGINAGQLDDATMAAAGLAAKYKIDLNSAMMLIGRASQGQTQMLTRYGIVLDSTLAPQEKFNQLLKIGKDNFGLAKAEAGTLSGRLSQLSNVWGDIKESIGAVIVNVLQLNDGLEGSTNKLSEFSDMFKRDVPAISSFIQDLFAGVSATFQKFWVLLSSSFENISKVFQWIGDNWSTLWTNAPLVVYSVLGDILNAFRNLGESIFKIGGATWDAIVSVIKGGGLQDALSSVLDTAVTSFAKTLSKIGRETGKSIDKFGVSKLDLTGFDEIGKKWQQIDEETAKRRDEIFNNTMDKLNEGRSGSSTFGIKAGENAANAAAAKAKQESSIVSAVLKGSVEALRIENSRTTKEDKIAENTKRTATATERMAEGIQKLANGGGVLAMAGIPEDPF